MSTKMANLEELRRKVRAAEREVEEERAHEIRLEFLEVERRSRDNPDLATRLAGIAEVARMAKKCPDLFDGWVRRELLTWIEIEADEWIIVDVLPGGDDE